MGKTKSLNILGLNGSPHRRGNTATLMGWVLEGCVAAGATVQWLHLVDYHIGCCQGCMTCLRTGACCVRDDLPAVRDRILASDGLVIGSPVYGSSMTAQMKTLLDRLTLIKLQALVFEHGHWAGVSCSGIAPTFKQVARSFQELSWCSGVIGANCSAVQHGVRPLAEFHDARLPERARALGRKLVHEIGHQPRISSQSLAFLWVKFLHRRFLRPMVHNNPEEFAGVLRIWQQKGWA